MFEINVSLNKDVFDYLIGIFPILIAITAIVISGIQCRQLEEQIKIQKKQWLYNDVAKYEVETLLDFLKDYKKLWFVFHWFLYDFAHQFREKIHIDHFQENQVFERETFVKYWNQINHLYRKFSKNQIIFQKVGIAENIKYLECILNTVNIYINKTQNLEIESEIKNGQTFYELKDIEEIRLIIAKEAEHIISKSEIYKSYSEDELINLLNKYPYYWNIINKNILDIGKNLETYLFGYNGNTTQINCNYSIREFLPERDLV